ncbi:unnamed protein product [Phytomonas sp. EM1]|nr:unnamed protein product [Phytomonas sp. EM1]|eukprot:CCW61220.1 unnamed protein product [Phytomonas sp. isolate EM1]
MSSRRTTQKENTPQPPKRSLPQRGRFPAISKLLSRPASRPAVPAFAPGRSRQPSREVSSIQPHHPRLDRDPRYGEILADDHVHDEIRDLGREVRTALRQHLVRHATTEAQVLDGIRRFGPSPASKRILNRENEAARLALEKGFYVVWRCTAPPRLPGANTDFCCRVGPSHTCFCGHRLTAHAGFADGAPFSSSSSSFSPLSRGFPCAEPRCGCPRFHYLPNEPEEIGEGWLSRRVGWDPAAWSPACRCGHPAHAHASTPPFRCRHKTEEGGRGGCRCKGFSGRFCCVVCDLPWEAHETVVETVEERRRAGLPVGPAFFPLADVDWGVRERVLEDPTGGGGAPTPSFSFY